VEEPDIYDADQENGEVVIVKFHREGTTFRRVKWAILVRLNNAHGCSFQGSQLKGNLRHSVPLIMKKRAYAK